jgi:hypothetical protein
MRPVRRYVLHFAHPDTEVRVKLMATGDTPCNAKNTAWTLLERYLAIEEHLPRTGWRLAFFEDNGIVGS